MPVPIQAMNVLYQTLRTLRVEKDVDAAEWMVDLDISSSPAPPSKSSGGRGCGGIASSSARSCVPPEQTSKKAEAPQIASRGGGL
ncbi:hypothetical protein PG990_000252 [Apiospora arundinis]